MNLRQTIFEIIEPSSTNNKLSNAYDIIMLTTIIISIIPLAFKTQYSVFNYIDTITLYIFILDYILRFITADLKLSTRKLKGFIIYPFTPMAVIDFISILPSISVISNGFKLFKLFRLFRTLRVMRIFKIVRYSKSIGIIINVFKRQKSSLLMVCCLAMAYILISALVILNVEPESFNSYFDAVYWATVSLTTVGYGDIYPVSSFGKIVTMISSVFGIAIIALPAGIITAGLMDEINNRS